ncbi:MAG: proline racemase family protein [Bacillota bacterium]
MRFERLITVVDSHTEGEPTRIVTGGFPYLPGATMAQKRDYLMKNLDHLRGFLMREPRGHADMFGAVLTEPTHPEADLGVIFMDTFGFLNMCGHGCIGVASAALETGLVASREGEPEVVLDTPAGLVRAKAVMEGDLVKSVTITNVPSFLFAGDVSVPVPGHGDVKVDVSFGGNFFGIVSSDQVGEISLENLGELVQIGMRILRELQDFPVRHPVQTHISSIDLVEISGPPSNPRAHARNVVIFGEGQVDRSPCGTGTSAKMAALHAKGKLPLGQEFVHESILGTLFAGRLVGQAKVGEFDAVQPTITARAHITGLNNLVMHPDDPLKMGFRL